MGQPAHQDELTDASLSPLVAAASTASTEAQAALLAATRIELATLVCAAVGGAITALGYAVGPYLAVVSFAVALLSRLYVYRTRPDRAWYDGWAVAESAKTLAWRYAVGGRPFGLGSESQQAIDEHFVSELRGVMELLVYSATEPQAGPQITDEMRSLRALPLEDRREAYEIGRIADQQDWYGRRSRFNASRSRVWARLLLGSEAIGIALGVAAVAGWLTLDPFGVAAATAAAFSAWLQIKQHESLARAYAVAAQELSAIRSLVTRQTSEQQWEDFVDQAEEAVSREHTLWRASRGVVGPVRSFQRDATRAGAGRA